MNQRGNKIYNPLFTKEMGAAIRKHTKDVDASCRSVKLCLLRIYPSEVDSIEKVWRRGKRKIFSYGLKKLELEGDQVNSDLLKVLINARPFMNNISDEGLYKILDLKIKIIEKVKCKLKDIEVNGPIKIWRPFDV
uniref:THUMP domain-containing protein n=1 Tax=Parastrongyloides trichosuri TaxID=131310 RepID=A0A0N4ZP83_PARTI